MVTLKKLIVVVLAMLSNACHTSYELSRYRFQVTDDYTDEQYAEMQAEVDHLCEVNDGYCITVARAPSPNKIIIGDLGGNWSGKFQVNADLTSTVVLDYEVVEMGYLARAFRHELGHATGCLSDSTDARDVMYIERYVVPNDLEWTKHDLDCIMSARK